MLLFEQEEKEEEELGAILDAKSRYEIAREAAKSGEICKRGGTRNTEIFKTVREEEKPERTLLLGRKWRRRGREHGKRRRRRERIRGKLVESNASGKPKSKRKDWTKD